MASDTALKLLELAEVFDKNRVYFISSIWRARLITRLRRR